MLFYGLVYIPLSKERDFKEALDDIKMNSLEIIGYKMLGEAFFIFALPYTF